MKTYVVNMEKDTQKRELITKQLKQHPELDWQIWNAVEGRKLSEEEQIDMILPEFKKRYGKDASLPAAGCSLSHISIYRDLIAKDIPYALVLEDDAILSKELYIKKLTPLLDTESPVALLLTSDFWYYKCDYICDTSNLHKVFKLQNGNMTSGYLINRSAAKLLLKNIYPVQYLADAWAVFMQFGLQLYGIVPHVISFPDECGEIGNAGNTPTTLWQKIRFKLILCYLFTVRFPKYFKGLRKSKKKWK